MVGAVVSLGKRGEIPEVGQGHFARPRNFKMFIFMLLRLWIQVLSVSKYLKSLITVRSLSKSFNLENDKSLVMEASSVTIFLIIKSE